ncbi:MAG: hypothetical protein E6J20_17215 [Chloroflexi bacterium]|nr:MAG: hypothetical protein E6J20_17215 [Chloroflexota bacterium]
MTAIAVAIKAADVQPDVAPKDEAAEWTMATLPKRRGGYRCDECGARADTIHFLPRIVDCDEVRFACAEHDPGGYWVSFKRWVTPLHRGYTFADHIWQKHGGPIALLLLAQRLADGDA